MDEKNTIGVDPGKELKNVKAVPIYRQKPFVVVIAVAATIIIAVAIAVILYINRDIRAEAITLNENSIELDVDESASVGYAIYPEKTTDKSVKWSSSDSSIATVNNKGLITGVSKGDVTITATTENKKTDSCDVSVVKKYSLSDIYDMNCEPPWGVLASDKSYLLIDTKPSDLLGLEYDEAAQAIVNVNEALGLPDSVITKMSQTNALAGIQEETFEKLTVSWSYHPDNGLEVLYEIK